MVAEDHRVAHDPHFFYVYHPASARLPRWPLAGARIPVLCTGPYAYVRHPMYAGALWLFIGMPLALGSWLTICLVPLILPVLFWRLLDEERILRRDLPGYKGIRKPCAPSSHTVHLVGIVEQT